MLPKRATKGHAIKRLDSVGQKALATASTPAPPRADAAAADSPRANDTLMSLVVATDHTDDEVTLYAPRPAIDERHLPSVVLEETPPTVLHRYEVPGDVREAARAHLEQLRAARALVPAAGRSAREAMTQVGRPQVDSEIDVRPARPAITGLSIGAVLVAIGACAGVGVGLRQVDAQRAHGVQTAAMVQSNIATAAIHRDRVVTIATPPPAATATTTSVADGIAAEPVDVVGNRALAEPPPSAAETKEQPTPRAEKTATKPDAKLEWKTRLPIHVAPRAAKTDGRSAGADVASAARVSLLAKQQLGDVIP